MGIRVDIEDGEVRSALNRLIQFARNPAPAMREIAALGETSTRLRFRTQTGPDGKPWKKSNRAKDKGGRTLTLDGHLGDSVSSSSGAFHAEWGVNRIYAAIHQFGGVIKPKRARFLSIPLTTKARLTGSPRQYEGKLFFLETKEGRFLVDKATGEAQYLLLKKVTIPARPFLGISNDDREDIIDVVNRRINAVSGGAAHAR